MRNALLFSLTACAAGAAFAQGEARKDPDPADPQAVVSVLSHRSVFEEYRAYREPEVAPWREANEEAGRAGGHSGHVKPAATIEPVGKPEASDHEGHR